MFCIPRFTVKLSPPDVSAFITFDGSFKPKLSRLTSSPVKVFFAERSARSEVMDEGFAAFKLAEP